MCNTGKDGRDGRDGVSGVKVGLFFSLVLCTKTGLNKDLITLQINQCFLTQIIECCGRTDVCCRAKITFGSFFRETKVNRGYEDETGKWAPKLVHFTF